MSIQTLTSYLQDPSTNYLKVEEGKLSLAGRKAVNFTDRLQRFIGRLGYGPYSLAQVAHAVIALQDQQPELIEEAYHLLKEKITHHNSKSLLFFQIKVEFPKDPDVEQPFPIVFHQESDSEKHGYVCSRLNTAGLTYSSDSKKRTITLYHGLNEIGAFIGTEGLHGYFDHKLSLEKPWWERRSRFSAFHISQDTCAEFSGRTKELVKRATAWLAKKNTTQCMVKDTVDTPLQLLQEYNGFIVGENHLDNAARKYLVDNMSELRKQGVTHLFLEHLAYDSIQKHLDAYFASNETKLPKLLETLLSCINPFLAPKEYQYTHLVEAAKKAGIRVVAIDTTVSYSCGTSQTWGVTDPKSRYAAMNYVATRIIQREMANAKGQKYVALTGSGHVATMNKEQVAGVAELLHVPSVVIETNKEKQTTIQRNVKDLASQISHVGLYLQTPIKNGPGPFSTWLKAFS